VDGANPADDRGRISDCGRMLTLENRFADLGFPNGVLEPDRAERVLLRDAEPIERPVRRRADRQVEAAVSETCAVKSCEGVHLCLVPLAVPLAHTFSNAVDRKKRAAGEAEPPAAQNLT
jgi:hypothetical protein